MKNGAPLSETKRGSTVFSGDLESYIRERRQTTPLLLMTHIVMGYPNFDESLRVVEAMVEAGVDVMELQIPFSEPMADGPVIVRANAEALAQGASVEQSLRFAEAVASRFDIPFVLMTYFNIIYRFGAAAFVQEMVKLGVQGAIVPDLPPEEGEAYLQAMHEAKLCPVFIYSPQSSSARMQQLAQSARGMVYCVARKGVTGAQTDFSAQLDPYLARCREATDLPLALGFGVSSPEDMRFLSGRVDLAVVGSQSIREYDRGGVEALKSFTQELCAARG